jgi:hypothetical protein
MEQPLQRSGGEEQRHADLFPHHRRRHIDIGNACQNIWYKITIVKGRTVAALRHFVITGPVNIIEHGRGQALPGKPAEILYIMAIGKLQNPPPSFASALAEAILLQPELLGGDGVDRLDRQSFS